MHQQDRFTWRGNPVELQFETIGGGDLVHLHLVAAFLDQLWDTHVTGTTTLSLSAYYIFYPFCVLTTQKSEANISKSAFDAHRPGGRLLQQHSCTQTQRPLRKLVEEATLVIRVNLANSHK